MWLCHGLETFDSAVLQSDRYLSLMEANRDIFIQSKSLDFLEVSVSLS